MIRKKFLISIVLITLLISAGISFYLVNNNQKQDTIYTKNTGQVTLNEPLLSTEKQKKRVKENKYYVVYSQAGTSFIPEILNPGFSRSDGYDISISFDDSGNLINDGKIILVKDYSLSEDNKEMIKEIAGDKYEEAIEEIEERLLESKKNSGL